MTTLNTQSLDNLKRIQANLTQRLVHFRRRVRLRLVIEGVAIVVTEMAAIAFLTLFFDWYLRLSAPARVLMLVAAVGWLSWEIYKRIVLPCRVRLGLIALA